LPTLPHERVPVGVRGCLVGRDGQPKITILQQGLFRVERSSDRASCPH